MEAGVLHCLLSGKSVPALQRNPGKAWLFPLGGESSRPKFPHLEAELGPDRGCSQAADSRMVPSLDGAVGPRSLLEAGLTLRPLRPCVWDDKLNTLFFFPS